MYGAILRDNTNVDVSVMHVQLTLSRQALVESHRMFSVACARVLR
jgi:hypothetical protein